MVFKMVVRTLKSGIQTENGKQEASNKEFKAKNTRNANLSITITNLYATKFTWPFLMLVSTEPNKMLWKDLFKVGSQNCKAME